MFPKNPPRKQMISSKSVKSLLVTTLSELLYSFIMADAQLLIQGELGTKLHSWHWKENVICFTESLLKSNQRVLGFQDVLADSWELIYYYVFLRELF